MRHWNLVGNQGRGQSIMFGGGGAWAPSMASAGARAYNGSLGAEPLAGSRRRAPGQGGGEAPPEAANLLASGYATEAPNLPHSVRTLTLSK